MRALIPNAASTPTASAGTSTEPGAGRRPVAALLLAAALVAVAPPGRAAPPRQLPFQARLTEADGTSKPDGPYRLTFRLRTIPGPAVSVQRWIFTTDVLVQDGSFHVLLPPDEATGPSLPSFRERLCLSVQPAGEAELPCVELVPHPHSMRSDEVVRDGVDRLALADEAVGAADLVPDAVRRDEIQPSGAPAGPPPADAVGHADVDASSTVRGLECILSRDPTVAIHDGDETFFCSLDVTAEVAMNALLVLEVEAEHGCDELGTTDAVVWTRLNVFRANPPGGPKQLLETAYASSLVNFSNPDRDTPEERDGGHDSISMTLPVVLQPGENGISFEAAVDSTGCPAGSDAIWALWSLGRADLVLLGRAE